MLNRRTLLTADRRLCRHGPFARQGSGAGLPGIEKASMRGSINATELGVQPGTLDDQSKAFAKLLRDAQRAATCRCSCRRAPMWCPTFRCPAACGFPACRVRRGSSMAATATCFMAEQADHIELSGLVFDGSNRSMGDYAQGLLDLRRVGHLVVDNCQITGSGKNGLALERACGRVERSRHFGCGRRRHLFGRGRRPGRSSGNTVSDCANGGILVHRWQAAEDGTIVTGNRVERIGARSGGTGQNGNGINAFRAGNVIISGNVVSDCAFSAIRANSSSNLQISGNTCSRSGETAVYSEFSFEGAVISNNIVDGAANGISIVNFNEGGRMGVCSGNIVRNLSTSGPYTADPPGFGVGIGVEADTIAFPATSSRMRRSTACRSAGGRICAMWWPPATSSARPAPASSSAWSKVPARPSSPTMSSTACRTAPIIGQRWAEAGDRRPRPVKQQPAMRI